MQIKRILTPQIVAVLFDLTEESDIETTYEFLSGVILDTLKNLAQTFLKEKGISQDDIDKYFVDESIQNDFIEQLLNSEELEKVYEEGYNSVVKLIYDRQLRNMDESRKQKLQELLQMAEKSKETSRLTLDIQKSIISYFDDLKRTGQVTQDQINQALREAYDNVFVSTDGNGDESGVIRNQDVVNQSAEQSPTSPTSA